MSKNAKKVIVTNGDDQHTVKFYGKPTREELEETICAAANLPAGTRFKLLDSDGDPVVLSSAIPSNIKLTLEVLKSSDEVNSKKRRAAGGDSATNSGQAGSRKKLRSAHQEGAVLRGATPLICGWALIPCPGDALLLPSHAA